MHLANKESIRRDAVAASEGQDADGAPESLYGDYGVVVQPPVGNYGDLCAEPSYSTVAEIDLQREAVDDIFQDWRADNDHLLSLGLPGDVLELRERLNAAFAKASNCGSGTSFLHEVKEGLPIPLEKRAYFQARLLNRIYNFVLAKFHEQERTNKLTKAELARRIERDAASVNRLLGAPGNWRLETVSDLLLGINGEELELSSSYLDMKRFD